MMRKAKQTLGKLLKKVKVPVKLSLFIILLLSGSFWGCSESEENIKAVSSSQISHFLKKNEVISFKRKVISANQKNDEKNNKDRVYIISNIITSNKKYNAIVKDLIYKINLSEMTANISKKGQEEEVDCDLLPNGEGLYAMVLREQRSVNRNTSESNKTSSWLCAIRCGARAFLISEMDGPAPFADLVAIAYAIDCGSNC